MKGTICCLFVPASWETMVWKAVKQYSGADE
jgi:hypothetical protein